MRRGSMLALALVGAGACSFFDPLDQDGLHVFVLPQDTAVYVGNSYQAVGLMLNKYIDVYPSEHIAYGGLDPQATVSASGVVSGVSWGRARVMVSRGDLSDTAWVSVVPVGTIAVSRLADPSRVDIMGVDGSAYSSPVASGQVGGGAPAWLPGPGAGFAYQLAIPGGAGAKQIWVSNLAGTITRLIAPAGANPRVARDGSWVYFENGGIWRVHVDSTGTEQVTTGADVQPDPSPDGTKLAFARHPLVGNFQLAVRNLTAGTDTVFSTEGMFPRWSPSGDSLAYWAGNQGNGQGAIYIAAANGSGARQVSAAGSIYRSQGLDWSPDAQWLLARGDTTLDLIRVSSGQTIPLGYAHDFVWFASWKW